MRIGKKRSSGALSRVRRQMPFVAGGSDGKASAYSAEDPGSTSRSGRSPGEGSGTPLQCLAWKIPWTEEPGRLQSMGSQRVGHD